MESAGQKFHRLVTALDELVTQETVNLNDRDFEAVLDIQARAEPVIAAIVALGSEAVDQLNRARLTSLLARRQGNIDVIESQLAATRDELHAVQASTARVSRIAPVYGRAEIYAAATAPQFSAAG